IAMTDTSCERISTWRPSLYRTDLHWVANGAMGFQVSRRLNALPTDDLVEVACLALGSLVFDDKRKLAFVEHVEASVPADRFQRVLARREIESWQAGPVLALSALHTSRLRGACLRPFA